MFYGVGLTFSPPGRGGGGRILSLLGCLNQHRTYNATNAVLILITNRVFGLFVRPSNRYMYNTNPVVQSAAQLCVFFSALIITTQGWGGGVNVSYRYADSG